jgi:hypothetical protein
MLDSDEDPFAAQQEQYWNSLTKQQQLDVFCAVVRRIHKGEVQLQGSYRYVLYDVFGFDMDSYVAAQYAGFLDIHNLLWDALENEKSSP